MNIDKIKVVKIDGVSFLGELFKGEDSTELRYGQKFHQYDDGEGEVEKTFDLWIMNCNTGNLKTIEFSSMTSYTIKSLTEAETVAFEQRVADMKYVKKTAIPRLENEYYKKKR